MTKACGSSFVVDARREFTLNTAFVLPTKAWQIWQKINSWNTWRMLGTGCTDAGVRKYVPQLTQLEYLDVAKIPITNETAALFAQLPRLKLVHLSRLDYPAKYDLSDAVREIKAALPKCNINYWPPK